MADLRTELGKHPAGDRIVITLKRTLPSTEVPNTQNVVELKLEVTLGEDPK